MLIEYINNRKNAFLEKKVEEKLVFVHKCERFLYKRLQESAKDWDYVIKGTT